MKTPPREDLTLDDWYTGVILIGLIATQVDGDPDLDALREQAIDHGAKMAVQMRRRRMRRR